MTTAIAVTPGDYSPGVTVKLHAISSPQPERVTVMLRCAGGRLYRTIGNARDWRIGRQVAQPLPSETRRVILRAALCDAVGLHRGILDHQEATP